MKCSSLQETISFTPLGTSTSVSPHRVFPIFLGCHHYLDLIHHLHWQLLQDFVLSTSA
ncbi:hypothetical protein Taro_015844 [Colocasia esculenta]|uniref:Uncharacterized protein n=1 Tax=Colocasia esculenta TaxID=4460 RepID=A0A843UNI4_COLES|nr:hypothetical protein [Colocasia esculenta]